MQRWHHERHIARRNCRDLARLLDSDFDQPLDRSRQLGRFRKRNGLDCGKARCFLCHGDKLLTSCTEGNRTGSGSWLLTSRPMMGWGFDSPTFRLNGPMVKRMIMPRFYRGVPGSNPGRAADEEKQTEGLPDW
jgi:hypothetical protein